MLHRIELRAAVAVGLALATLGLGFWLGVRSAAPADAEAPGGRVPDLEPLRGALAAERAAREELAGRLSALEARTQALAAQRAVEAQQLSAAARAQAELPSPREEDVAASPAAGPQAPLFDVEALVAGCMRRGDAEQLRTRWERYELERLGLNDRARREGYFMRPRHRDEHAALDAAFRHEVGDDGYDAFLRATGRKNRVAVREILASGAGSAAGLEPGDVIESYAGARVFSPAELQLQTAAGRLGEMVEIEVLRGDEPVRLRAPRGPLGVALEGVVETPEGGC